MMCRMTQTKCIMDAVTSPIVDMRPSADRHMHKVLGICTLGTDA
jgi:hypothetical protein